MKANNTTGIRYLHIDYKDKYGNKYIVRHYIKGKSFVVWRGSDFDLGKEIAEEVAWKIAEGDAFFLSWYDNERLEYLASLGTTDGSLKTKWNKVIGKKYGPYIITKLLEPGPVLRESKVEVKCTKCGHTKQLLYKQIQVYPDTIKYCRYCDPNTKVYKRKK